MSTTPTNNAIPSESPADLAFNAGKIDEFVNSPEEAFSDRFGLARLTIAGIEAQAEGITLSLGFTPVDSFEAGATLTVRNQALHYLADGNYYRWDGALPKVVAAASTPASSGGVASGAWVNVTDNTLRSQLYSASGSQLVNYKLPSATGSVTRTIESKLAERATVKDFGAIGNGIANDTAAIQAAFTWAGANSVGRVLTIPAGRYLLTDSIKVNASNAQMVIKGEGRGVTTFVWSSTSTAHGLSFGDTTPFSRLFIGGMTLNTQLVNASPAIYAQANGSATNSFYAYDILAYGDGLLGTPANGYFGGGMIRAIDTNAPLFQDLVFYGVDGSRANFNLVSSGIFVQAQNFMTLVPRLVNVACSYVAYGMFFDSVHVAGIEGVVMDGCNAMCTFGIKVTAENATNPAYSPPQVNISKTQVEFFDIGFEMTHVSAVTIESATLLHRPDSTNLGTAIQFNNVSRGTITNNYIEQRPLTTLNGINIIGNSYGISCTNNTFDIRSGNTCIIFTGASYNCSQYLNKCVNTGALYANLSTQAATNTQNSYNSAGQLSSSLTDGTIMKAGSSVITTSAGGAFGVTFTAPFPNNNLTVVACNGDSATTTNPVVITSKSSSGFTGVFVGSGSGVTVRVNFYAMGN